MVKMARLELIWSQVPGVYSKFGSWMQIPRTWAIFHCFPIEVSRELHKKWSTRKQTRIHKEQKIRLLKDWATVKCKTSSTLAVTLCKFISLFGNKLSLAVNFLPYLPLFCIWLLIPVCAFGMSQDFSVFLSHPHLSLHFLK